jgi:aryl-phospho-beta-D-glucosidase BglC (GH1 family)
MRVRHRRDLLEGFMNNRCFVCVAVLALVTASTMGSAVASESGSGGYDWWNTPYPQPFDANGLEMTLDTIRVDGNRFVDEQGERVIFKGVAIADPDKLVTQGQWNRGLLEEVKSWGANIVRIPVHPVAWRGRGKDDFLALLDEAVTWATELELYVMVDWHSIGNLLTGVYQHPMYDTTSEETFNFWRTIAARYKGLPTVAFYEIFNEPTTFNGQLGSANWEDWKALNEEIIGIIQAHDRDVIALVAGFNWAYSLVPVGDAPIDAEGIGYVSHPYPMKVEQPWEEKWERDYGFVADTYPVFVTEFGYILEDHPDAHIPAIGDEEYGKAVTDYFDSKGISWTAWCFDPDWPAQLISDWEYTPTPAGTFFREVMSRD